LATLALAAVGAGIGGALLPSGIGILGATLTGAAIGSQVGALAGSVIDQSLFGASGQRRRVDGPRLSDLHVTASTEGTAIPRVYGRVRLGGQVIWAADIEEQATTSEARGAPKGGGTGGGAKTTTYSYFATFAVALCEGEIAGIGRAWANGAELELSEIAHRVYPGSRTQAPDTSIAARLSSDMAPAFRDTAYVVFERLPLEAYGNRLPQLSFEVHRAVDDVARQFRSVVLIPGSGEFAYDPEPVTVTAGLGVSQADNTHTRQGGTDWAVSLDQLAAALPAVRHVSLVVAWFGTDLRAGTCDLRPGVERRDKETSPTIWTVSGENRSAAHVVSQRDGRPAYGGTPADGAVVRAIRDLRSRGLAVTMNPFVLMDIPAGNTLPDPYDGSPDQPAYPWRGRITVDPAPGRTGTVDKTPGAATQLARFIGTAAVADFTLAGDTVVYTGPAEWSYRRMILHHAMLAKAAGGVDAFLLGSEMRGVSTVRSAPSTFPFVAALVALAADVKAILGPATKVTYAADWSEYFGHQPADGSGDVLFHLDPVWASPAIDAIGIDLYWPLSDWRDGRTHLDYQAGYRHIYDLDYLMANVAGGEGYDWYYASAQDRIDQRRTTITDGLGKPWIYRYKDLTSWWRTPHHDRIGGVERTTPTAWVPQSKPFWLTEVGCGAVDKASNQPNVFVDPKSAENALPYFSRGTRDDLIQRRYLEAIVASFDPDRPGFVTDRNPVSTLTGQRMIDLDRLSVYAWDARPFPAFPFSADVWGDADNWRLGHWLNGRLAGVAIADVVAAIARDHGFDRIDARRLTGTAAGYVVDRVMSAREALQPFELAYFIDTVEHDGVIAFRPRGGDPTAVTLTAEDLVETGKAEPLHVFTRAQETDLPAVAKLRYLTAANDYRQAVAESRRLTGASGRVAQADVAIVLDEDRAATIADTWLYEAWAARERVVLTVPPSLLALEPGDTIAVETGAVQTGSGARLYRITDIGDHGARQIEASSIDPEIYGTTVQPERPAPRGDVGPVGRPAVALLDLPLLLGTESPDTGYAAATATPWPSGVAVYASPEASGFRLRTVATRAATMGLTTTTLTAGPTGRLDRARTVDVTLGSGTLRSLTLAQVLSGANAAAIRTPTGAWEVFQFTTATLLAPSTYRLAGLLRGQAGTGADMATSVPPGSLLVLLDDALTPIALTPSETRLPLSWRYGPANRSIGDATYTTVTHTFQALGHRPLAPVHVRGRRAADGTLTVTWVRRTRVGGDTWDGLDVPLAEDAERYEVEILINSVVKRTLAVTAPGFTYDVAMQTADFGAVPLAVTVRVAQLSTVFGRGATTTRTL
jgi:hypothetical protein